MYSIFKMNMEFDTCQNNNKLWAWYCKYPIFDSTTNKYLNMDEPITILFNFYTISKMKSKVINTKENKNILTEVDNG